MNALKDKNYKNYTYTCRYSAFPYYYNKLDDKYMYGLTGHINKDIPFIVHKIRDTDTLDSLALKYYGRPDNFWVIADFNDITDCLESLVSFGKTIRVPTLSAIAFSEEER